MSCSDLIDDPLIEAAVRPLADNAEMQLAAAGLLQGIRRPEPDQEGEAIAVWARPENGRKLANWKIGLCGVLALVSAFVGITKSGDAIRYYQWASYWFRQDRLMRFDPAFPGWTRYEFEVADQMRKGSREVLGCVP